MAESADKDQKTEEPTAKRLEDARKEGNLPVSREFSNFVASIVILFVFLWMVGPLGKSMVSTLRVFIEKPHMIDLTNGGFVNTIMGFFAGIAMPTAVIFASFLGGAILGAMVQTDFYMGTAKLKWELKKLNPKQGFKKIFSMNAITELIKSSMKLIVLGYIAYLVIKGTIDVLPQLIELTLYHDLLFVHKKLIHMLIYFNLIIVVIAIGDLLYTRYQYFKQLRMTKQEVKDENKQTEGDPLIKSRLRQIRMEKARRRMMANVPDANVIVVNPTHYAVALKYDRLQMAAPVVTAKGVDEVALRIREVGEEHDIPFVSNPTLSRALFDTVELDEPVDPEHYRAVAEVISYVYKLKNPE